MAIMATSLSTTPTPTPTFRQKPPPLLYLTVLHRVNTTTSHFAYCAHEVLMPRSGRDPIPVAIMLQHLCICRNLFLYNARVIRRRLYRDPRRWARSAHLHDVRHMRHHHHHHHHNHNHNHHGINVSANSTGAGENESADVFTAAPSRGSHPTQSAPVAGYFGTDDALVRMWMPTRTQLGEPGDGEEGGAGAVIWVDTDTDADVDTSRTGTDSDADEPPSATPLSEIRILTRGGK